MVRSAIGLRKLSATYASCSASVLRTNLRRFQIDRLGPCAAAALITWMGAESEGWASPPKEYPPCTSEADDTNVQAARGAFEAGKAAFNEADYPRAIFYWEDAFRRDCSATLMLKNLARAYEASAQYPEAAVALETYLARAPEAEDKADLEEQLRAIRAKFEAPAAPPKVSAKPVAAARAEPAPQAQPPAASAQPVAADETDGFTADTSDDKPVNGTKLAAGLVAGGGLALGAASAVFWLDADTDEQAATSQCPTRRDCPKSVTEAGNDAIDRKQVWALVGIGGGAMLVGGIVWYLVAANAEADKPEAVATSIVPALAPGFAGLTWTNRF